MVMDTRRDSSKEERRGRCFLSIYVDVTSVFRIAKIADPPAAMFLLKTKEERGGGETGIYLYKGARGRFFDNLFQRRRNKIMEN